MSRLVAVLLVCAPFLANAAPAVPDGYWLGTLDVGAAKMRIGLHVTKKPDGTVAAALNSLDQGSGDMAADKTSFVAPTLDVELTKLGVHYVGSIAGDELAGTFTQAGHAFPLSLRRVAGFDKPKRPQEPKRPFPYREEEVTITVPGGYGPQRASVAVTLAGTLTLPPGKGPFPAVLFITGSGPEDRDETVFDHKPFLVISDALTRAGIATLRFDDRGTGKSQGSLSGMTVSDNASDAKAELELLARRPEVDGKRLGIIGHSEGGVLAPMVATMSPLPRFLVLLAGTGVPGLEVLETQTQAMMKVGGATEAQMAKSKKANATLWKLMLKEPDPARLEAAVKTALASDPESLKEALPQLSMATPWLREFMALDPKTYLGKVKIPVLAMNGDKDLQVDVSNLEAIRAALARGGNTHVTIARMPGLNHLFQHTKTGSPNEYSTLEETFAPEAITTIRDYILVR